MSGLDRRGAAEVSEEAALAALAAVAQGVSDPSAFADWWRWWDQQEEDSALRRMVAGFVLSRPEAELVALLLASEVSESVARAVADVASAAGGIAAGGIPFWLACRAVSGLDASALAEAAPLVRLRVVHATTDVPRVECRLRLTASVVDRLLGVTVLDADLAARMSLLPDAPPGMLEQHAAHGAGDDATAALARDLAAALGSRGPLGVPPLVLATHATASDLGRALRTAGLLPWAVTASALPEDHDELDRLARTWSREAALDGAALIVLGADDANPHALAAFLDRVLGHVVLAAPSAPVGVRRGVHLLHQGPDSPDVVLMRWARELGPQRVRRLGPGLASVATHFRLDEGGIARAVATASPAVDAAPDPASAVRALWHVAARAVTPMPHPGIRILEPAYCWDDLVLPAETEAALRRLEVHVRHAARVLDDWGFAGRLGGGGGWRGRGVAALFSGQSGTGKTMAAEVIASSLDLRVMAIDLSQVISKYVGETSKNIAAAFDEAERSGAVMVWNEGDAVWGTRGGVGNAVDRHVNAEVGDLLQRIEEFSGFTLVTTNLRQAIDPAFLRRFRFVVDFPVPSEAERLRLWQAAFPQATPIEDLQWEHLASLPLTGGSIRNVALGAAFLAAEAGTPVDRSMIESELGQELRKQDLPMPRLSWADPS